MTTSAQLKANRSNAKKSTGPQTENGKKRVAKNAPTHGLLARDTVLPGEDPADFDIQPANSLEFELVRQIADSQWRMRRLTRLETGFLAAAIADKRRLTERFHPERLQPGYDGETLLLGSGMINRTQALVHLARYDGHLSRRFFRAVKQLADLRECTTQARHLRHTRELPHPRCPRPLPQPIRTRPGPTTDRFSDPDSPPRRLPGQSRLGTRRWPPSPTSVSPTGRSNTKKPNKPNSAELPWNQPPTADRPTTQPVAAACGPAPRSY